MATPLEPLRTGYLLTSIVEIPTYQWPSSHSGHYSNPLAP